MFSFETTFLALFELISQYVVFYEEAKHYLFHVKKLKTLIMNKGIGSHKIQKCVIYFN